MQRSRMVQAWLLSTFETARARSLCRPICMASLEGLRHQQLGNNHRALNDATPFPQYIIQSAGQSINSYRNYRIISEQSLPVFGIITSKRITEAIPHRCRARYGAAKRSDIKSHAVMTDLSLVRSPKFCNAS